MRSLFDLTGRTALVTGSARGIGFALARGLAQAGAKVWINGTREETVASAVATIREEGFDVIGRHFDVTDEAQVVSAFESWDDAGVRIDIVINNAGIQFRKPLAGC